MTQPATTFALLRQQGTCESGYRKLARRLGGVTKYGRDKSIPLLTILDSNGLDDALWCLHATVEPWKREAAFVADCVKHVKHAKADGYIHKSTWIVTSCVAEAVFWNTPFDKSNAARKAERDWQAKRLRQYLTGTARKLKRAA